MSHSLDRRTFLQAGITGAASMTLPGMVPTLWADEPKQLCLVRAKDIGKVQDEALNDLAVTLTKKAIESLGGMQRFVSKGDVVWIKPNMAWDRSPEQAANTNPSVVKTLVELAFEAGAAKVKVSDNSCNEARPSYENSGIQKAADEAGAEVLFHDERKYKEMDIQGDAFKSWPLYVDIIEADKLINVPIAKHHRIANLTLSMKNLMGVMGGSRGQTHQKLGLFLADLCKFIKPQLTVIDAIRIMTQNGPTGGSLSDVARRDTIIAGTDFVAADACAVSLFESMKIDQVAAILEGEKLGLGTTKYESLIGEPIIVG